MSASHLLEIGALHSISHAVRHRLLKQNVVRAHHPAKIKGILWVWRHSTTLPQHRWGEHVLKAVPSVETSDSSIVGDRHHDFVRACDDVPQQLCADTLALVFWSNQHVLKEYISGCRGIEALRFQPELFRLWPRSIRQARCWPQFLYTVLA